MNYIKQARKNRAKMWAENPLLFVVITMMKWSLMLSAASFVLKKLVNRSS